MQVQIITGAIGSGKTQLCIEKIRKTHEISPSHRCIMLVPPHYSHETERMLINAFGGTGLNNIECTSFEKLARELLPSGEMRLGASGKNALLCRAISLSLSELEGSDDKYDRKIIRAVSKQGFVDVAASLMSEMHRYNVSTDDLSGFTDECDNPLLIQKLKILTLISKKYTELLADTEYIDSDNDLIRLAGVIPAHFDSNDNIWIDKFDEFLPEQLQAVYALIDSGAKLTITFNTCPNANDTYYGTKNAIADIMEYCNADIVQLEESLLHINAPELRFLFTNWHNREVYTGECANAELFIARDAYTETEYTARKILDLVREEGHRFCDIGVLCQSHDSYSHIIEAVFDEYEIPYYTDSKIAISEYPIAMQILSLFNVITQNRSYSSMFEYLRAGFVYTKKHTPDGKVKYARLNQNDIDLLENYVLKYGIEYKSAWSRSWLEKSCSMLETAFGGESESTASEKLEKLRKTVIAPIDHYDEAIKASKTVSDYCRALFGFLEDINLYQGLKAELLTMALNDASADGQRFGQIWNLILGILDEVNTALGTQEVSHEEFSEYINAAMNRCRISTVPSGIDRVFIASADTNRAIPTPVMFVLGAVSGTFPSISLQEGFLSNADRTAMHDGNIRLAPTTEKKAEKEANTIYKLMSAVKDSLYLSYPSMTSDGASNLPSQMITDIIAKLPNIRIADDIIGTDDMLYISSPKATMHRFLINPTDNPIWSHVNDWFNEHEMWRNRLFRIKNARYTFSRRSIELNPEIAQSLYEGKNRYSATRLNSYASCPFGHFMQYGLSAREREEYEIKAKDTGSYAHEIIQRFCSAVKESNKLSWDNMGDKDCTELVSGLVSDTIDKINDSELRDKEMTADILNRMGKTVAEAAKTVCRSIKCGDFEIESCEKEITVRLTDNIEIGGIIDRLDVCRHDGVNEYRIIDYKTGAKEFSPADIYNGIDMQPVIYALAMRMLDDKATISGMYYSPVNNDFAKIDVTGKVQTAESNLKKNTAYKGVTFVGQNANEPVPQEEIDRVESELARSEGTMFFSGRNNEYGYGKSVRPRPDGEWLMERVRDNIIKANKNIRNGHIDISPLENGTRSSCTYCPYHSVCRFDEDEKIPRTVAEKDSDIWNMTEEEP